jgi:hypothetical protein
LAGALVLAGPLAATAADDQPAEHGVVTDPHGVATDPHAAAPAAPGKTAVIVAPQAGAPAEVRVEPGTDPATIHVDPPDGATTVEVAPGAEARAGFAGSGTPTTSSPEQLRNQQRMARDSRAPFMNTLILAPRGMAALDQLDSLDDSGNRAGTLGLELDHVLGGPLSLVVGGEVGQRDRGPGFDDVTTLGLNAGLNLFLFGGHNEGFYVGPRIGFAAAGVADEVDGTGDRLAYGGELGFRAIVGPGLTAGIAAGVMNQTRGTVNLDRDVAASDGGLTDRDNFGYGAVQLGWSG